MRSKMWISLFCLIESKTYLTLGKFEYSVIVL